MRQRIKRSNRTTEGGSSESERRPLAASARIDARQRSFLAAYRKLGNVAMAAHVAGVDCDRHSEWLADADYAAEFDRAREEAGRVLMAQARRRAVDGLAEPSDSPGEGTTEKPAVRTFDHTLLVFLIKSAQPEVRHDLVRGESEETEVRPPMPPGYSLDSFAEEELRQYIALVRKARVKG